MAERRQLRALAKRAGILAYYRTCTGGRRLTSDATREALLAALGFDGSTEQAARRALHAWDAREARALLDPVRVVQVGSARSVPLRAAPRGRCAWSLELRDEQGRVTRREGMLQRSARPPRLPLPAVPAAGYHTLRATLELPGGRREAEQRLIVTPATCVSVRKKLGRPRGFGLWTNLYSLRSARNAGAGDLGDLRRVLRLAGKAGASFVGLNPLHATWNRGDEVSPYSPLSRLYRSPLYIELEAVPELAESAAARRRLADPAFARRLHALREAQLVDYEATSRARREILEPLHASFAARHRGRDTARGRAYARYLEREAEPLSDFASFFALAEHLAAPGRGGPDWRQWPAAWREPRSPAVARFRREHAEAIDFQRWLQFELDRQLAGCARSARQAGLEIGLYQDLAVGAAPGGSDTWVWRDAFALDARVGAPPDPLGPLGQDWQIPPLHPLRLRESGYAFWVRLLRAAFAHAGALRIDHAMGLARLYWIPPGGTATEGAYVAYPATDLLGILALESRRHDALVIAEDLGTLPPAFPAQLARRGVLSSRVLYFERRGASFRPARAYSDRALVTANTHDLAPLAGFAAGRDLAMRHAAGELRAPDALAAARREREQTCRALARRLARSGLLRRGEPLPRPPQLVARVSTFLSRSPAPLVGISLDDLVGESEPVNLPGIPPDRHPSWRRKLAVAVEALGAHPGVRAGLAAVGVARRARRRRRS